MSRLLEISKLIVPSPARRILRAAHCEFIFRQSMKRFLAAPEACICPGSPVLMDLINGWGNQSWSAWGEYLAGCIGHALTSDGPILECGSGLSTILVGAIAKKRGMCHWVLEHAPEWAGKVRRYLKAYDLDSVILCVSPLKSYGDFDWYDAPLQLMPDAFSLVICDGPPGGTRGGRYGLVPVMKSRLGPGCVILLDDSAREQERAIAQRWRGELPADVESCASVKPYLKLTVAEASN